MTPLVSIMLPCYNSAKTLPWAIASIMAQTYTEWECIVVDDGSTDNPEAIVRLIDDPRIRFHRFAENRGRAAARQHALDLSRGKYVAMVDADDWIYPDKLAIQTRVMEDHPTLAVLSGGMAIVDSANNIDAVRLAENQLDELIVRHHQLKHPRLPPLAFAPSIIRASVAKSVGFDQRFVTVEDVDLLLNITLRHEWAVQREITYSYSELQSVSLSKILQANKYCRIMFTKYLDVFPQDVLRNLLLSHVKDLIYSVGFTAGLGTYMISRRSTTPSREQATEFRKAKWAVSTIGHHIFRDTAFADSFAGDTL